MPYGAPVIIDSVTFGEQWSEATPSTSMVFGPWLVGGNLYEVLVPQDTTGTSTPQLCNVWKSTDGGLTWTAMDSANAILVRGFQACCDGLKITVVNSLYPVGIIPVDMHVIEFDLATDLWGAQGGASPAQSVTGAQLILPRSDGSKIIVYASLANTNGDLDAVSWKAGVWGTPFNIVSFAPGNGFGFVSGCIDTTNTAHVFFTDLSNVSNYQAILLSNALGATSVLVDANFILEGIPICDGTRIMLPVGDSFGPAIRPSLWVGTPLAAPVWTLYSDIDPAYAASNNMGTSPMANIIGGKLYILSGYYNAAVQFRLSETSDFVTWGFSSTTVYDMLSTPPPPGVDFVGQTLTGYLVMSKGISVNMGNTVHPLYGGMQFFLPYTVPPVIVLSIVAGCIQASGGTAPYVYTVSAGALPGGLVLDSATGCITGTPLVTGTFSFDVTATDVNGNTGTISLQIAVSNGAVAFSLCQNICCTQLLGLGTTGGVSYSFPGSM